MLAKMRDLKSRKLILLKAGLFLCLGIAAAAILLLGRYSLLSVTLLVISIWAFCRAYYFAFYVIEHYIDDKFRYSGLISALTYLAKKKPSIE